MIGAMVQRPKFAQASASHHEEITPLARWVLGTVVLQLTAQVMDLAGDRLSKLLLSAPLTTIFTSTMLSLRCLGWLVQTTWTLTTGMIGSQIHIRRSVPSKVTAQSIKIKQHQMTKESTLMGTKCKCFAPLCTARRTGTSVVRTGEEDQWPRTSSPLRLIVLWIATGIA